MNIIKLFFLTAVFIATALMLSCSSNNVSEENKPSSSSIEETSSSSSAELSSSSEKPSSSIEKTSSSSSAELSSSSEKPSSSSSSALAEEQSGTFTDDRDEKIYKWVKIGTQIWMAENLNYVDSNWHDDTTWQLSVTPCSPGNPCTHWNLEQYQSTPLASWCYNHDESNCVTYGRLYTWNAAMVACPSGWKLPARQDWRDLAIALGDTNTIGHSETVGRLLKTTSGWLYNGNGTDDFGFSGLPSGSHEYDAYWDYSWFLYTSIQGLWWSSTEAGSNAYLRRLAANNIRLDEFLWGKSNGFSVRCIES